MQIEELSVDRKIICRFKKYSICRYFFDLHIILQSAYHTFIRMKFDALKKLRNKEAILSTYLKSVKCFQNELKVHLRVLLV